MTDLERAIHDACDTAGARPPKITHYANCIAVAFRNGDNLRVLVTLDLDVKPEAAAHKIAQAFKVKAENQPSEAALKKLNACQYEARPDPNWDGYPEHAPLVVYCTTHSLYGGCSSN